MRLAMGAVLHTRTAVVFIWLATAGSLAAFADEKKAQASADEHGRWATYRWLVGAWEGQLDDRFGTGSGHRKYELIFDDQFLVGWHSSLRLPQESSPEGDFHRELSIYSFDADRNTIVLRQFLIEGFVLQFTCNSEPMRLVCVSENVENGAEMSARLTIEFENKFRFSEKFELAGPGEDLQPFTAITFTRVPGLPEGQ